MGDRNVCVDFDGVINSYDSGFTAVDDLPDKPHPRAFRWLRSMNASGFKMNILSTRSASPAGLRAIKAWFIEHGWRVEPSTGEPEYLVFPTEKPPAIIYIDDRGFCFEGVFPTAHFINKFKPWNKK
jgi:hypothetical protein